MPISRKQVRQLCSPDEYELYCASLRLSLPELRMPQLQTYVRRARFLMGRLGALKKTRAPGPPRAPRKVDLLSGALSRFEGRLRLLATKAGPPRARSGKK